MTDLMLLCHIADRRVAIPACDVRSVIEIETVTPVPRAPAFVAGLTALRSQALTVIDCRAVLGFDRSAALAGSRAAVIQHEGHLYALVLDDVSDVEHIGGSMQQLRGGYGAAWADVACGMVETTGGPAIVLDIPALLGAPRSEAA